MTRHANAVVLIPDSCRASAILAFSSAFSSAVSTGILQIVLFPPFLVHAIYIVIIIMVCYYSDDEMARLYYLHGDIFSEIGDAAVHQIAHRLVVDAHNVAYVIILPLLHII